MTPIAEQLERTREAERTRIAREIHDELGQMLTVLKMDVSNMDQQIKNKGTDKVHDFCNQEIQKIKGRINALIESVHRITTELRPEVLEDLGFIEAVKWQAREFGKRVELEVSCNCQIETTDFLSDNQTSTLFRIFQETMSNVIRHSQASTVKINLHKMSGHFVISVIDDGIGITEKQKHASSSFGITGMRERVHFLGGEVYLEGKEDVGTQVTIQIPLKK